MRELYMHLKANISNFVTVYLPFGDNYHTCSNDVKIAHLQAVSFC